MNMNNDRRGISDLPEYQLDRVLGRLIDIWHQIEHEQPAMGTCARCGGKFPTRTSGIVAGVTVCMSATQCDTNLAAKAVR